MNPLPHYTCILLDRREGCWRLTLNRPDRLNSFTTQMHQEVADAICRVEADEYARVLVITGAGKAFCAGQDLAERDVDSDKPLDLGEAIERYYNPLVRKLTALRLPVICAVNGVAAGAGVNLVAACDIVIARRSAKFVQAFSSIGLIPDAGGSWHLPRLMGLNRALGFSLLGEALSAQQAQAFGLVWEVVEDDAFAARIDALEQKLGSGPTYGLGQAKRLIRNGLGCTLDEALASEREAQRQCGLASDYKEGVTAFKEKRTATFSGARPDV